jgi:hypothetical protein
MTSENCREFSIKASVQDVARTYRLIRELRLYHLCCGVLGGWPGTIFFLSLAVDAALLTLFLTVTPPVCSKVRPRFGSLHRLN